MEKNLTASRIALAAVIVVVGGSFMWWYRNRPSYLLYQAHNELGQGNQAGVITEYRRLLAGKNLSKEDEIRFRKALGEFYVRALQETNGISLTYKNSYEVENPFINDAKQEFTRVLALDPSDGPAHYYLGRILWMQRLEAFAIQELDLSRRTDPKNPASLWFLSLIHAERGDASLARDLALQALAIKEDFDEARLALVDAYSALGDHDNALKEYDRLSFSFKENPDTKAHHALYLSKQNEWGEADRAIEEAVRSAPDNGRIKLIYGRLLLERGFIEEAIGQFSQSSALMQRNVWPLVWKVEALSARGQCEEAQRLSQLVVEGLPRWGWAHLMNAWSHLCKGDEVVASAELDEAIRLAPELMEAQQLKAEILVDKQQFDQLGKVLRGLLEKKINQSEAYALLSRSFFLQGNYGLAQETAETAIKLNQRNADAFVSLALARGATKDFQGAGRAFENAAALRPFDVRIQALRIDSESQARALLRGHERSPELWVALAEIQRRTRRWPEAIEAYQNAVALKPYHLGAQLGLIDSFWMNKMPEKAEAALDSCLQINSKNKEVLAWRGKIHKSR